jgi:hypothetical protein
VSKCRWICPTDLLDASPQATKSCLLGPWTLEFELAASGQPAVKISARDPGAPPHAPNAFRSSFGITDSSPRRARGRGGGLFVLSSRTTTSRAHPVPFWEPSPKPVLVPGQSPCAALAHVTSAARPSQRCPKPEGDCPRSLSGQTLHCTSCHTVGRRQGRSSANGLPTRTKPR